MFATTKKMTKMATCSARRGHSPLAGATQWMVKPVGSIKEAPGRFLFGDRKAARSAFPLAQRSSSNPFIAVSDRPSTTLEPLQSESSRTLAPTSCLGPPTRVGASF
ncbi:hypothetical protein ZHAS_00020712 [Anopheles sinensis]|uniref:Uncharacterized protein n=1 Tax=Anopheles sinensis TaxID=74873 RepID=A0A084WQH6_ANOSI|nr:hypothetical protein ZHAS_00020712 [Anopheles sinensis]